MKIYLASSWKNPHQPAALQALVEAGHRVYDFRHPAPDDSGFSWRKTAPPGMNGAADYQPGAKVTIPALRETLKHPVARRGFKFDFSAMRQCDAVVLLLPCGNSAHMEFGWATGAGKLAVVCAPDGVNLEPELMYLQGNGLCQGYSELLAYLAQWESPGTLVAHPGFVEDAAREGLSPTHWVFMGKAA